MLPIRRSDPGRIGARPRRARRRSLGRLLGGVLAALAVALALPSLAAAPPAPDGAPPSLPLTVLGGRVTTWFAPTDSGFVVIDGQRVHDGIDIATYCGDTVSAAHAGTVLYAGRRSEGYLGFAAHLSRARVTKGDHVEAGQRIGREGATGNATGCHLHYGLIRMDGAWLPVAPDLVERWRYPISGRERVDPLRRPWPVENGGPGAAPARPPPEISPGYGPLAPLLESQRRRHEAEQPTPD